MEKPQQAQNQNYSYTPPVNQQPQPQVVYVQSPKKNSFLKYLLSCGLIFLIFACICSLPLLIIASFSSQISKSVTEGANDRIKEETLMNAGNTSSSEDAKIALIDVEGEITYSLPNQSFQTGANSENITAQLQKAKDDKDINAVLIRFNSPGGEVTAAEPLCRKIKEVASTKPVYTFIDSEGASLAYLLPNCTKYIYARPESVTGSIGVVLQAVDFYGVLEKLGGKVVFVTNSAGTQKTGQGIFDPNSDTYKNYQSILDETYNYFIDTVYEGRHQNNPDLKREDLLPYADGRIFSGKQASSLKLVDEISQFPEAVSSLVDRENSLRDKNVKVVQYSVSSSPFDQLFFGMKTMFQSADVKKSLQKSGVKLLMQEGVVDFSKPEAEQK